MNYILLVLLSLLLTINDSAKDKIVPCLPPAKCIGSNPCYACSNCNYCKYCNSGGTCGVCAKPKKTQTKPLYSQPKSNQCKAITKKGTRCSRKAEYSGYCWQHKH